jgi:ATP-dependent DNA ligase
MKTARLAGRAPRAPLPAEPQPMLCTLADEPPAVPGWIFEPKFDGLRVLVRFDGRSLTLLSRNDQSQNVQFPEVVAALRAALDRPAVLDGEIVCFDERGRASFRKLQQRFHLKDAAAVRERARQFPASIQVFDLLHLDGHDVTGLPLAERKELLRGAVRWGAGVRPTEFREGGGRELLRQACAAGEEGLIAKRMASPYRAGRSEP